MPLFGLRARLTGPSSRPSRSSPSGAGPVRWNARPLRIISVPCARAGICARFRRRSGGFPATAALFQTVRPAPPPGTAGLICYGYRGIEDRAVGAVQLEAVSAQATRIPWPPDGAPRVSAAGSRFDSGRQRFEVLDGSAERVFLVEGPVSALAAPGLFPELASGWSVAGVAGWAGFRRQAVGRARLVRICPDGDDDGIRAVERLAADLEACGIKVLVDPVPAGFDLLDLYRAGAPYGSPGAPAAVLPGYAGGQAASHGV